MTRAQRYRVFLLLVFLIAAAQALPLAIPTTIVPPRSPADPVTVFLVDYGRTPSLVLPAGEDGMVAYVYGDWRYYALRQQGVFDSVAALLWPTQGALGRRSIAGPRDAHTVRTGIGTGIDALHELEVDREAVERLQMRLDRLFRQGQDTTVDAYGMTFVHHPRSYTYWSNSNHMTAGWLEELGCDIRGPAFNSSWRVRSMT